MYSVASTIKTINNKNIINIEINFNIDYRFCSFIFVARHHAARWLEEWKEK
jgi:hypothetical protein